MKAYIYIDESGTPSLEIDKSGVLPYMVYSAVEAMEKMLLPAYKAENGSDFTRVTLYPKKSVSDLTKEERIEACYQHCCLAYADNETMNNQSVRERFGLNKNQGTIASHIIADTVAKGLIKSSNPDSDSRKFISYVPFYA